MIDEAAVLRVRYGNILGLDSAAPLPHWCVAELIETMEARNRIRSWVEAGSPTTRVSDVHVVADDLEPLVHEALAGLPPPVLLHLARHAFVVALGRSVGGYCMTPPPPRVDSVEGRRLLLADWHEGAESEIAFRSAIKHEVAHHVLEPGPGLVRPPLAVEATRDARENRLALVRLGKEWNKLDRVIGPETERELRASRLAFAWGASGRGADCRVALEVTRLRIELEAQVAIRGEMQ